MFYDTFSHVQTGIAGNNLLFVLLGTLGDDTPHPEYVEFIGAVNFYNHICHSFYERCLIILTYFTTTRT